jgi:hypothetical protein
VFPGSPGIGGDFPHKRDFRLVACGDWRVLAGVSGDLLRDLRGMVRCLNRKPAGCLRDESFVFFPHPEPRSSLNPPRFRREDARARQGHIPGSLALVASSILRGDLLNAM